MRAIWSLLVAVAVVTPTTAPAEAAVPAVTEQMFLEKTPAEAHRPERLSLFPYPSLTPSPLVVEEPERLELPVTDH
jgi:hypothetical protein